MGSMKDSLGDRPYTTAYPGRPGAKAAGTSEEAARAVAGKAETLRVQVFDAILRAGSPGATPDEVAAALGETVLAVRPRVTELHHAGKIQTTGERRANASGLKANVWRAI